MSVKEIWKWKLLNVNQVNTLSMPMGARILFVGNQVAPTIWAQVDPELERRDRKFLVVGTGMKFDDKGKEYLGTAFCGPFVWHVFEVKE